MKKIIFGLIAMVVLGFVGNAQKKLSAEDQASLQEIVKKVTSIAEEKKSIVTFYLVYKEGFTNNFLTVDEDNKLADELGDRAVKGNMTLTFSNGESTSCKGEDFDSILANVSRYVREGNIKGMYVPRSFEGLSEDKSRDFVNDKDFIDYFKNELSVYQNVKDKDLLKKLTDENITNWNEENINRLANALGLTFEELQSYFLSQNKKLQTLNSKYNLSQLTSEKMSNIIVSNPNNFGIPENQTQSWGCSAVYWACSAGVFAVAVLAEVGCAALDIETYGTARIIGCYAAVGVGFASGIVACQHARDSCNK